MAAGRILNFYHIGKVLPDGAVYIGRQNNRFGLKESKYANPFPISDSSPRREVIEKYRVWLWDKIKRGDFSLEEIASLYEVDFVCYCVPQECHGEVLRAASKWAKEKLERVKHVL